MRGGAALAVGLALLTLFQTRFFVSEEALWTRAQQMAPQSPTPLMGLAAVYVEHRQYVRAGWYLDAAREQPTHTATERAWVQDIEGALRARIYLATGQLTAAAHLLAEGPPNSERWALCQHYVSVCALAASSR